MMKKKLKIFIMLLSMLSFLITQVVSHDVFNFIENSDKRVIVLNINKNLSKTNFILVKKRNKIYDDILFTLFSFDIYQNSDSTHSEIIASQITPHTAEYSVWSRSTFS
jgi:hypothetical protein